MARRRKSIRKRAPKIAAVPQEDEVADEAEVVEDVDVESQDEEKVVVHVEDVDGEPEAGEDMEEVAGETDEEEDSEEVRRREKAEEEWNVFREEHHESTLIPLHLIRWGKT
jgi:hypothetical protein